MARKLIAMIPTGGKTREEMQEAIEEAWPGIQKKINEFNKETEEKGMLAPEPSKDNLQMVSFWKKPSYPKKLLYSFLLGIKKRINQVKMK